VLGGGRRRKFAYLYELLAFSHNRSFVWLQDKIGNVTRHVRHEAGFKPVMLVVPRPFSIAE
jgi:hypothetical protein